MCKTDWNQYTAGLARDAKARKAADAVAEPQAAAAPDLEAAEPGGPKRGRKRKGTEPSHRRASGGYGRP